MGPQTWTRSLGLNTKYTKEHTGEREEIREKKEVKKVSTFIAVYLR
jgi:hypothetical protein